jgi:hypothetical protein
VSAAKAPAPATAPVRLCANCRHFRGDAPDVEAHLRGMRTLGSAYGAVRATDGICTLHDRYLNPSSTCDSHEPASR